MRIDPYLRVDDIAFSTARAELESRRGEPLHCCRNGVGLHELDYGDAVFRFQDRGRLEEVTKRAPVLYLGSVDLPFPALAAFVRAHDSDCLDRAGFLVSPRFGLAFVPERPDWVTAVAAHCIATWRAIG